METREIFRQFPGWLEITFYVVALITIAVFVYGFFLRYKKYRRGRDAGRFNNLFGRFLKAAAIMAGNRTIFKRDRPSDDDGPSGRKKTASTGLYQRGYGS